jgi:NAD(P)-dependent dehydrogenase (short-subunit alcohol dehydrogenase family)
MTERTYVVTGSASGIGAATAAWLRGRGNRVICCDLADAEVIGDLATGEGRAAMVDGVTACSGGRIDAIVANAGGGPPKTMLALNFFGAVATLEGLRPLLAGSAAPRAVVISSVSSPGSPDVDLVRACQAGDEDAAKALGAAAAGREGLNLYGSAKHALNRWCRRVAVGSDWAGAGIPLNVIAPGVFHTPAAAWILDDPAARAEMMARVPLPSVRPGRPQELAALVGWCASAENSLMTGQVLFADGGLECLARGGAW